MNASANFTGKREGMSLPLSSAGRDEPVIVCFCGRDLGYLIAGFLLEKAPNALFVVNPGEHTGSWYRSPRELRIREIKRRTLSGSHPISFSLLFTTAFFLQPSSDRQALGAGTCTWEIRKDTGAPIRTSGRFGTVTPHTPWPSTGWTRGSIRVPFSPDILSTVPGVHGARPVRSDGG